MSDLIKCDACRGSKSVVSLGNISKKCSKCSGIGFVESNLSDLISLSSDQNQEPRRKYGRPKKEVLNA